MVTTEQIRKLIEDKKVTIGTDATTSALTGGLLKRVLVAANAAPATKSALERHTSLTGVELEVLSVTNDQLGTMCKKPFAISVLGIRK